MHKKIKHICVSFLLLMSIGIGGCANQTADEKNSYIVLEMPKDLEIGETFQFKSISQYSLREAASGFGMEEGVYSIGELANGNAVVWRSDSDKPGYSNYWFILKTN